MSFSAQNVSHNTRAAFSIKTHVDNMPVQNTCQSHQGLRTGYGLHNRCESRLLCAHGRGCSGQYHEFRYVLLPVPERSRIGCCQTSEGVLATSSPSQAWSSHEPMALGLCLCWYWSRLVVLDHWQQGEPCSVCICEQMCRKMMSHLYACLMCFRHGKWRSRCAALPSSALLAQDLNDCLLEVTAGKHRGLQQP